MSINNKKRFYLYLSDSENERISKLAAFNNMSMNTYIRNLVLNNIPDDEDINHPSCSVSSDQSKKDTLKITVTNAEKSILKYSAASMGLTMSEYLRQCIRLKKLQYFSINIKIHDLSDQSILIGQLCRKVEGICSIISRSKNIHIQEVDKIKTLLVDINNLNLKLIDEIYKDRKKLYSDAKKEVLKNIRNPKG